MSHKVHGFWFDFSILAYNGSLEFGSISKCVLVMFF